MSFKWPRLDMVKVAKSSKSGKIEKKVLLVNEPRYSNGMGWNGMGMSYEQKEKLDHLDNLSDFIRLVNGCAHQWYTLCHDFQNFS